MIRITIEKRSDEIKEKLDAGYKLPEPSMLMNSGERRTPEKRRLLEAIEEAAAAVNRTAPFKARY